MQERDSEEMAMKTIIAGLALAFTIVATAAVAQPVAFPANEMGVSMGHWHLNSRDAAVNRNFFVALGGRVVKRGENEVVLFPGVVVFLTRGQGTAPTGGTAGTVVNHVGFTVRNVQESLAKWKAAGIQAEPSATGRPDQAYIDTPDGLRIEILEDKNQPWPIRNEHIHFAATEAEIPKMQAWYVKEFGGHAWTRNNAPVVELPGVQLRFAKVDKAQAPTAGHTLDHIGFDVKNLDAFLKRLQADGVKVERPINRDPQTGAALAFVSDPWGTMIELNDRPVPIQ
jgi:catechol 2,3-dioxygenase-like lactoylglutathione lyase family enzyme